MTGQQILQVYWSQPLSLREIAKNFGVSHMSVWRLVSASSQPTASERRSQGPQGLGKPIACWR